MLYKNIRAVRHELGLSQQDVASILGISLKSYRCKEKGERPFHQVEIMRFMSETNISLLEAAEIFLSKEVNDELYKKYYIEKE